MENSTLKPWNLNRVITKVNTKYGAPMGRADIGTKPTDKTKVYNKRVQLIEGYDNGGAYWGIGSELRVSFTADLSYIEFYRK